MFSHFVRNPLGELFFLFPFATMFVSPKKGSHFKVKHEYRRMEYAITHSVCVLGLIDMDVRDIDIVESAEGR